MTRLQVRTRKRDGKEYLEYSLNLPPKIVARMGWEKGDEILVTPNEKHLTLRKMEAR